MSHAQKKFSSSDVKPIRLDIVSQHDLRVKNLELLKKQACVAVEPKDKLMEKHSEAPEKIEAASPAQFRRHRASIGGYRAPVHAKTVSGRLKKAGVFNHESALRHQRRIEPGHRTNVGGLGHEKGPSPAPANRPSSNKAKKK